MKYIASFAITMLFAIPTAAQWLDPANFERFLLPIDLVSPTNPTSYGSVWDTRLFIRNHSDTSITVGQGEPSCTVCPGAGGLVQVRAKTTARTRSGYGNGNPGSIFHIEKGRRKDVTISSRLVDRSRLNDHGVSLPVVFEEEFFRGQRSILDVPATPSARRLLRIYETDGNNNVEFRIRIVHEQSGDERVYRSFTARGGGPPESNFVWFPGYLQLPFDGPETDGTYRLEIEPLNAATRWWAFVSITDNTSQRVTLAVSER